MIVEFESKFAKKKEDLICDVIAFGAEKLFPSEDAVYINIQAINKEGLCGDCMFEDDDDRSHTDCATCTSRIRVRLLHEAPTVSVQ